MPEPVDIYLLAGQSNMSGQGQADQVPDALREPHASALIYFAPLSPPGDSLLDRPHAREWSPLAPGSGDPEGGFGPELSFGHTLAARQPDRRVAVIKAAKGGSSLLRDWRPQDFDDPTTFTNWMLRDAAQAIEQLYEQGYDPRFAGFLWYQGEAETRPWIERPEDYTPALDTLLERISDDLNDGQDFAKVFFRVNPHNAEQPHFDSVRAQLMARADADPLGAWIDVDDLNYPDRLHPDGPSLLIAGDRAAEALAKLTATQDAPASPEPQNQAADTLTEPEPEPEAESKPEPVKASPPEAAPAEKPAAPPTAAKPQPAKITPLPKPPQTPTHSLMNQKGGVGKTTTAVNVGAALANLGLRVLCIDLDPQAHLTLSLGIDPDDIEKSNYDLLTDADTTAMETVRYTARDDKRLAVLPAETNLAGVESELSDMIATGLAQTILRNKCKDLVKEFDYVLIDCPPSLGLLTINALTMADEIVVPMQAHFLALQGMTKLFETIGMVRQGINPQLTVAGVVLCMHEGNTLLANEVISELEGFFDAARGTDQPWADGRVFTPPVRRNIKLAEAPSFGQSVHAYAPDSNGAKDYLSLARSIAGE
ncbi:MAG: AAA family ATPase [Planctomycetota bacterium]